MSCKRCFFGWVLFSFIYGYTLHSLQSIELPMKRYPRKSAPQKPFNEAYQSLSDWGGTCFFLPLDFPDSSWWLSECWSAFNQISYGKYLWLSVPSPPPPPSSSPPSTKFQNPQWFLCEQCYSVGFYRGLSTPHPPGLQWPRIPPAEADTRAPLPPECIAA